MGKILLKFQTNKIIQEMYELEYLYFTPLKYFKNDATGHGQKDFREGNLLISQMKDIKLFINGNELTGTISGQYQEHREQEDTMCLSLYAIDVNANGNKSDFDSEMLGMGDTALVIYKSVQFLKIVDEACRAANYKNPYYGQVTYYDPSTMEGEITPYHKDKKYLWQSEYRITFEAQSDIGLRLYLPGLKDCCKIIPAIEVPNLQIALKS